MKRKEITSNVVAGKRAERLTNAKLTLRRAEREIQTMPGARATPLIKDLRLALLALIEEVEFSKP